MKPQRLTIGIVTALAVAVFFAIALPLAAQAQNPATVNWTLHNLDLAGSRFSPMTQINRTNVKALAPRWLFQHGVIDGVSNQTTPVVVDGRMYVTDSRGSVYALDAADGHLLWTYDVTSLIGGGAREGYVFRNRGVVYANGVVYAAAGSFLFALDATTGKPLPGFGNNGQASVILDVLRERYPDVKTAISMGYWFTTAPQVLQRRAVHRQHAQREPHPRRARAGRRREDRQGPLGVQHGSAERKRSGLGHRGTDVGGRRAQRRRHLGDARDRSRARPGLRRGRQSVRRQQEARRARTSSAIRSSR